MKTIVKNTAPVALFVYNRPEHTRRTLDLLREDQLACQTELIIFSDGPRSLNDQQKVRDVRELLRDIDGFRSVTVRAAEGNRGLAKSIIAGVTEVVEKYGRVIVLEDDLVVSPYFLSYMNDALELYENVDRVMHVCGYWYPVQCADIPDTFFLRYPSSWGWGTWKRAWQHFRKDPEGLQKSFSKADIQKFNLDGAVNIWEQVLHNLNGKADTWAVFWYASLFHRGGLSLYPSRSLVKNVGMDGSGQHCLKTRMYENALSSANIEVVAAALKEDSVALDCLKQFYIRNRTNRLMRFVKVVSSRIGNYCDMKRTEYRKRAGRS